MRAIAILAAIAMVVSLFLPWLRSGGNFTPWDLIRHLDLELQAAQDFVLSAPLALLCFLASFLLAGIFALLAIIGLPLRLLALASSGLAVGLVGWNLWRLRQNGADIGVPLPQDFGTTELLRLGGQVLNFGAWAWGGGAVLLLICGIVGFNRR